MSPSAQAEQWGVAGTCLGAGCTSAPPCAVPRSQPAGQGQCAAADTQLCTAAAGLGAALPALRCELSVGQRRTQG